MSHGRELDVYVRDQAFCLIPFSYLHKRIPLMRQDQNQPRSLQGIGTVLLKPLYAGRTYVFESTLNPKGSGVRVVLTLRPVVIDGRRYLEVAGNNPSIIAFTDYLKGLNHG